MARLLTELRSSMELNWCSATRPRWSADSHMLVPRPVVHVTMLGQRMSV
jgi:hypothetical protein